MTLPYPMTLTLPHDPNPTLYQVAYREAITKEATIDYTHKKQSGGSGQFAKIQVRDRLRLRLRVRLRVRVRVLRPVRQGPGQPRSANT